MKHIVEVLAAYSHSTQATDLRLCRTAARTSPVCAARPSTKRPWRLRDRLDERDIAELITAYRDGATAASLATTHGLSLKSVKRLLHTRYPPDATHSTIYEGNACRDVFLARPCPGAFTARSAADVRACRSQDRRLKRALGVMARQDRGGR
jgi:hypothetical protein